MIDAPTRDGQRAANYLLAFLAIVAGGAVLYLARSVILPLILAMFLTVVIGPLVGALRKKFPLWLSLILVLLGATALLAGGVVLFVLTGYQVAEKFPEYTERFQGHLNSMVGKARERGIDLDWNQIGIKKGAGFALQFVGAGLESVIGVIGQTAIVIFLTIFLALEAAQFRKKISAGFRSETSGKITASIAAIVDQIQKYAATKTLLSLMTGVVTYVVCLLYGVDFAFFWGVLAFLLNYIPNVGSMIAILPPVFLSFVETGGLTRPLLTLGTLVVAQNLIGNILEPKLLSRSMQVSALVVFLSMIFWGWLWGIVGVVLAVPLTVSVKIICGHVEMLRPFSVLLGGDPIEIDSIDRVTSSFNH